MKGPADRRPPVSCPGCGAVFAQADGPVHPYMASTPACWSAFGVVLAREYSSREYLDVHRLTVDAYAVQHPGEPSRQSIQSVGLHLVRLCLLLERNLPSSIANEAMLEAAKRKDAMTWLEPPLSRGGITVARVLEATDAESHRQAVAAWARSAWAAWHTHHETVRAWAGQVWGGG